MGVRPTVIHRTGEHDHLKGGERIVANPPVDLADNQAIEVATAPAAVR